MDVQNFVWNIIDSHFKENEHCLVEHHLESYNDFFKKDIYRIFKDKNPIQLQSNYDESIDDYRNKCFLYLGGKEGDKIYMGKPVIYDEKDNVHYMFPNEARLRNMTYGMTIHYDIDIVYIDILKKGEQPKMIVNDTIDALVESGEIYAEEKEFENFKETGNLEVKETLDNVGPTRIQPRTHQIKPYIMTPHVSSQMKKALEDSFIGPNIQKTTQTLEKVYLGKFPIMVQSKFCILNSLNKQARYQMGECTQDLGGYFIIQGKEKTVVCQEKFADNMLYIKKNDETSDYMLSAEIKSISENVAKPKRTLSIRMMSPNENFTNKNIVVNIPNVRKPIPLFILFRALGVLSDRSIIEMCLLDMEKYEHLIDVFVPSVHDAGGILTQKLALDYISTFIKGRRIEHVLEILSDYFLPHVGETNYIEKAYYLGYMVFRLLCVHSGLEQPTDRDNFKYKRIELIGSLLYDLFSEYYNDQQKFIRVEYDKRLTLNQSLYGNNLQSLIMDFQNDIFRNRVVEEGFKKAFKGNWGGKENTKRIGVLQDLNRLSFFTYLSHMRRTNLPLDASVKLVGPRVLHGSQWGFIDPLDTPDGGNIGVHKSLAITTHVSRGSKSREPLILWLREKISMKLLCELTPHILASMTKIIVNGYWCGAIYDPLDCIEKIRFYRRNSLIPFDTSVTFDIKLNTIFIYNDSGRLCRPIFYKDKTFSFENKDIRNILETYEFSYSDLVSGFNKKKVENFNYKHNTIYELFELYSGIESETNPNKFERFQNKKAIIDYIDSSESENAYIAINQEKMNQRHTHLEIHESLILGSMGNMITFPENNPPTRNLFSCGQSKQACSRYHSNYQLRMDKSAVVLNYGQTPLVKTRYLEHITNEQLPYGENTIMAIMCYNGYNVEDAVLINEGSLGRGLFQTTYYTTYESHEEMKDTTIGMIETKFANIENMNDIIGLKAGCDYSQLDKYGLIKENTDVDENTIIIGTYNKSPNNPFVDMSKKPKKGQLGVVDKTFITDNDEGQRIAKVRVREVRIPNLGDKLASRCGQKGTVGLVIPEADMPFTKDGLKPDIIINPHAIPSRMTIGQLIETLMGKACVMSGGFGDCTAFVNKGQKVGVFGELLSKHGFHSSGNDILYNGMTGEQIESEIFMGPNYYMRLKHMVKDKINFRARGPNASLTRQPVSGRANDGGLRIGEMERDSLISHGIVDFLTESMMERSDKYKMAICNNSGMMAIYNPDKNIFVSPMCDGPLQYTGSVDGSMLINNVTKYGRNFSIVKVPYNMKLLIQELAAINVQMRLITEDNIEQIENMHFTNNVFELGNIDNFEKLKQTIKQNYQRKQFVDESPEILVKSPVESPPYAPGSTPEFSPKSPAYAPDDSESPPYAPGSTPEFSPKSPPYAPGSESPPYAPGSESPQWRPTTSPVLDNVTPEHNPNSPPYAPELYSPTSPEEPPPDLLTVTNSPLNPKTPLSEPSKSASIQNITSPNEEVYREDGILTPGKDENITLGGSSVPHNDAAVPKINIDVAPVFNVIGDNNTIKELPLSHTNENNGVQAPFEKPIIFKNAPQIEPPAIAEPMEPDFNKGIIKIKKIE